MKNTFIFCIFGISLMTVQTGFAQDPFNNPLYNTLYSKDCTIPEQAQVIHYPMAHPEVGLISFVNFFSSKTDKDAKNKKDEAETNSITVVYTTNEDEMIHIEKGMDFNYNLFDNASPAISYSSFQLIQLLKDHPSALVFDESLWTKNTAKGLEVEAKIFEFIFKNLLPFAVLRNQFFDFQINTMSLKYTSSYQNLDETENQILSTYSGGIAALYLGIIDQIHPTTNIATIKKALEQYWVQHSFSPDAVYNKMNRNITELDNLSLEFKKANTEEEKKVIKNQFYTTYKDFEYLNNLYHNFLIQWRESLLLDSVEPVLKEQTEHQNSPIIIAYGMLHDFSDEFSNYNFYTIPHACSIPSPFVLHNILTMAFASQRYVEETNEDNQNVLYQFLYEKWNQISENQKNTLKRSASISNLLISDFEQIRRIINKETFSDEENFEFIFNSFISEEITLILPSARRTLRIISDLYQSPTI